MASFFVKIVENKKREVSLPPKELVSFCVYSNSKIVFKGYSPDQGMLFPPNLNDFIEENHPVRVVNDIINKLDIDCLIAKYKGGGSSSYHPRLMLKILVYGYLNNIYSSRKLEQVTRRDVHFIWLSGMSTPDHNTINRFRSDRLKGIVREVFTNVVLLLVESGHIDLKTVYTDGTKIEANANKYTFVWGKAIQRNKLRIKDQLSDLWKYAESVAADELKDNSPSDFEQIDAQKVEQTIDQINEALKDKKVDKKIKQKLNYAKRNWPKNLEKYKQQEKLMGERNSYSKTDPDATFMRMKEDPMLNGQLKAGYNLQISTQDQYIVHYSLHPNPTDTKTLIPHLKGFKENYSKLPETLTADAGYGSEENYTFLEKENVDAFVKYNYFHKEQKTKKPNPFHPNNLYYNKEKDCYYCPMGQTMVYKGQKKAKSKTGFEQIYSIYQAQNCKGCPLRSECHKAKGNRTIHINHNLNRLKEKARQNLLSEQGIKHRKKRPCDVETVFGNLKQNKKFKRFNLRGNENVEIETGLLAIAMNLKKMAG
jgi:transposase